jgi:hypothetical protein
MKALEQLAGAGIGIARKENKVIVFYAIAGQPAVRFQDAGCEVLLLRGDARPTRIIAANRYGIAVASSEAENIVSFLDQNTPRDALAKSYSRGMGTHIAACANKEHTAIGFVAYSDLPTKKELYDVDPRLHAAFINSEGITGAVAVTSVCDHVALTVFNAMSESRNGVVAVEYTFGNPRIKGAFITDQDISVVRF